MQQGIVDNTCRDSTGLYVGWKMHASNDAIVGVIGGARKNRYGLLWNHVGKQNTHFKSEGGVIARIGKIRGLYYDDFNIGIDYKRTPALEIALRRDSGGIAVLVDVVKELGCKTEEFQGGNWLPLHRRSGRQSFRHQLARV